MLDPETKKALQVIRYRIGQALQRDDLTLQDFEDILVCLAALIKTGPFISKFLRWLGQFTRMPEVVEGARQKGGSAAVWGLNLFGKIVRKL